jgi:hypothetical protein
MLEEKHVFVHHEKYVVCSTWVSVKACTEQTGQQHQQQSWVRIAPLCTNKTEGKYVFVFFLHPEKYRSTWIIVKACTEQTGQHQQQQSAVKFAFIYTKTARRKHVFVHPAKYMYMYNPFSLNKCWSMRQTGKQHPFATSAAAVVSLELSANPKNVNAPTAPTRYPSPDLLLSACRK